VPVVACQSDGWGGGLGADEQIVSAAWCSLAARGRSKPSKLANGIDADSEHERQTRGK
jgi:hypothetical protein